jgi:hypothetical protein
MSTEQSRFQVFVSSTYLDLREPRQQVTMTLLECDAFPTGMEIFPAADDDAWTLIRRVIDESDYYLLISAGKYGSIDERTGLSYTEMEYDYAVSAGKPVMAFLHGNLEELKSGLCESSEELQEKLTRFREKVKKARHVKFWTSPDELAGQVALTYNKFIRQYPATGWLRADQITSTESLKELVDAKSRVQQLEAALAAAQTSAPTGTENLAQGDDKMDLPFYASARYKGPSGVFLDVGGWTGVEITWDALFGSIAPQLLQEAEEAALREGIQQFLFNEFSEDYFDAIKTAMKKKGSNLTGKEIYNPTGGTPKIKVDDEEFGTILVQFMALGLIRRSDRKRSLRDAGTYWALTPYGEKRTIQLRAMKKTSDAGAAHPAVASAAADNAVDGAGRV